MADMRHAAPVNDQEFADALNMLSPRLPAAIGVSGGADSMALLHLAYRWLFNQGRSPELLALTVDHGLRDASAMEAQLIAGWCRSLGVAHEILRWEGDKPVSDIQAAARRARYSLMTEACRQNGINSLLLGHNLEDQAETFLLRLGRGSGVDGLSAMAAEHEWNGVRLLRPLLGFSRLRLRETLKAQQLPWIEDPSNHDPRFARVRVRERLADFAAAGISPVRLAETAGRMRRVRLALESATSRLMRDAVQWDPSGYASLSLPPLMAAPEEIGLRTLSRVLMGVGGVEYPPRLARLERLFAWLKQNPGTGGRTLSGCRILLRRHRMLVVRELSAIGPEIKLLPGETRQWDNRFQVGLGAPGAALAACTVREVGAAGLSQLSEFPQKNLPPRIICQSVPGFWHGGRLLAAPCLGYRDPACPAGDAAFMTRFAPAHMELPEYMPERRNA